MAATKAAHIRAGGGCSGSRFRYQLTYRALFPEALGPLPAEPGGPLRSRAASLPVGRGAIHRDVRRNDGTAQVLYAWTGRQDAQCRLCAPRRVRRATKPRITLHITRSFGTIRRPNCRGFAKSCTLKFPVDLEILFSRVSLVLLVFSLEMKTHVTKSWREIAYYLSGCLLRQALWGKRLRVNTTTRNEVT